ncbi:MAG: GNAT family N-acetyltransferase [Dongiaceae bacterium]
MEIRSIGPGDAAWVSGALVEHFASPRIVSRGVLHQADTLPGLVAVAATDPVGFLLYERRADACEVVALVSLREGRGVATALLDAVRRTAQAAGCRRLWLTTTNDNVAAIAFYERRGWTRCATRKGAMVEARKLKPELPERGHGGVPIRDEIEFELRLGP